MLVTEAVTSRITAIEGVLARADIQLAEGPRIRLVPASHSIRILPALAELAVNDPLDAGPGELELAQVFLTDRHREGSLTPGVFLARLLAHVDDQRPTPVSTTLEQLADLHGRFALDLLPVEPVKALERAIAALRN